MQQNGVEKYDVLRIKLSKNLYFLIDTEDYDVAKKYLWHTMRVKKKKGDIIYVRSKVGDKYVYLHNLLLKKPKGKFVDHINRNALDNRKSNLRIATRQQNSFNRRSSKKNKTGYIGVIRHKKTPIHPYYAKVSKDNKNYVVGFFKTALEAAIARDKKAIELHGEFAVLNFKKKYERKN